MANAIARAAAVAVLLLASCGKGGESRVAWDDAAGDVKPYTSAPLQPRLDIVRVEVEGRDDTLRLRVRLRDSLDDFFGYTRPDGKKSGAVAAQFFIDTDDNPQTGGFPMFAKESLRPLRGYEFQVSLQLGYRYRNGAATGTGTGDVAVDTKRYTHVQPVAVFAVGKLKQGSAEYDFQGLNLPRDSRETAFKSTSWKGDTLEAAVPYAWLGLKAGKTIRLCFKEVAQGPGAAKGYSEDKRLRLQ
jgi:hypothetical protein